MNDQQRSLTVLGATGSVGASTLDLVRRNRGRFRIVALTANRRVNELAALAREFRPQLAVVADPSRYHDLKDALADCPDVKVGAGLDALAEAADMPSDMVMAAIVGAAGLKPTMHAVARGTVLILANKECLVCAGDLMIAQAREAGTTLLPADSEHNAIFQVLDRTAPDSVERLTLTASGGPFRMLPMDRFATVSPDEAVAHPNWDMGRKISVDSATMMNKGLEVIEAHHLFNMPSKTIDVVIHPQSVIHSLVHYVDGSVLAQLGTADMRIPIAYCLGWPERLETPCKRLDLAGLGEMTFQAPEAARFPCLFLARAALEAGGAASLVLNAANEVAVAAFLGGDIGFLDISAIVSETLETADMKAPQCLASVMEADSAARRLAEAAALRRAARSA
ncbi:1-deoxy-D-xylulose-5-phosphate reductoisomerase [Eilatimonas milleporae]|uniref:1-deoxy-D-xylulose 5-phosphate reductoisomerase n=1 Tax=Eilatimonas milleporae TaxID=911205 RepID=A0A3M0CHI2_9PROT|nr:1-deoxy-D-xylulose-5-phosphate reductoisomerase [Eilatimonas milleporae]RMB08812.1 1-deoxy-D-xylulose 5-phosphate reductoisomerase [Eilatimonas milleporae]